ncbi:unnamed protein product, partial [Sphagnum balticum]
EEVDRSIMEANARMEQVLTRFQELVQESGLKENPLSMRDAQAAIATIAEEYNPKHGEVDMPFLQKNGSDGTKGVLAVADKVVIRQLGKLPATVVEPPQGDTEPKYEVAVQTSRNTLDLCGCQVEDSCR